MTADPTETFLRDFHARHPGVTSRAFGTGRSADGRSSYELLRDEVAGFPRVLDLACGDGFLLELLSRAGHFAAGLDLSTTDLVIASENSTALVEGRAQQLPFADNAFDACVSHMAFMLMSDIDQVATELARVLRPGGRLSLVLSGGAGGGEAYALFTRLLREILAEAPAEEHLPRLGDRRTRTADGLREILSPAGFGPVRWRTEPLDFGASLDQVWEFVAAAYNLQPLSEGAVEALRGAFHAQAPALAAPDGRIPLVFRVQLATVHKGH
ncbi:class I SAM-dependent methyltransferase [Amycolatopsis benzoatilytica]|uniref:class I SAM-dependent methyltransferase n=1 Tax=Amycolatopsis benzoatilytica TaxID=346045 RepID=UPI00037D2270|nr:class I SAM-dependent methyltransferase [Amycolatopsis benzoatilytica]